MLFILILCYILLGISSTAFDRKFVFDRPDVVFSDSKTTNETKKLNASFLLDNNDVNMTTVRTGNTSLVPITPKELQKLRKQQFLERIHRIRTHSKFYYDFIDKSDEEYRKNLTKVVENRQQLRGSRTNNCTTSSLWSCYCNLNISDVIDAVANQEYWNVKSCRNETEIAVFVHIGLQTYSDVRLMQNIRYAFV